MIEKRVIKVCKMTFVISSWSDLVKKKINFKFANKYFIFRDSKESIGYL